MRELRAFYQRHIGTALAASAILHLILIIGLMVIWPSVWMQEPELPVRLLPYMRPDLVFVQPVAPESDTPGGSPMRRPPAPPTSPEALPGIPVPDRPEVETTTAFAPVVPDQPVAGIGGSSPGGEGYGPGGVRGPGSGAARPAEEAVLPPPPSEVSPRLLKKVEPAYPRLAKLAGVEGLVVLSLQVDESGNVSEAKVIKSLGNTGCDEAAVTAALQWKFAPALRQGKPASVWITAPILFTLRHAR